MDIHSPLSAGLDDDIIKASKILTSFLYPSELRYTNKYIPSNILESCKGLAIITVVKAGGGWSARAGTGLVVAKLSDGSWSAPSAIGIAGIGFGGQFGAEITDFVMILNTDEALKAFTRHGSLTLGASVSIVAGPVGRTAEYSGSINDAAPIYSYSKSKGLFVGVSLEGSAILEREEANEKFYANKVRASDILSGQVKPPQQAQVLYDAIQHRAIQSEQATSSDHSNGPEDTQSLHGCASNQTQGHRDSLGKKGQQLDQNNYNGEKTHTIVDLLQ